MPSPVTSGQSSTACRARPATWSACKPPWTAGRWKFSIRPACARRARSWNRRASAWRDGRFPRPTWSSWSSIARCPGTGRTRPWSIPIPRPCTSTIRATCPPLLVRGRRVWNLRDACSRNRRLVPCHCRPPGAKPASIWGSGTVRTAADRADSRVSLGSVAWDWPAQNRSGGGYAVYPTLVRFAVGQTWPHAMADFFVGGKDGRSQKKMLSAAFLHPWPLQATRRFGSGSRVATSKKRLFGVIEAVLYAHLCILLSLKVLLAQRKLREYDRLTL